MLLFISVCSFPWWLWWLLPFLLGFLAAWLWRGKLKSRIEELELNLKKSRKRTKDIEEELDTCNASNAEIGSEIALLEGRLRESQASLTLLQSQGSGALGIKAKVEEPDPIPDPVEESQVVEAPSVIIEKVVEPELVVDYEEVIAEEVKVDKVVTAVEETSASSTPLSAVPAAHKAKRKIDKYAALKPDNLQVVEGIGPKMNGVLNDAGITTWAELGAKTPEEIRAILDAANAKRYRIIDPSTWADQARLAGEGKWEELIKLQKGLDAGRATGATGETDSKVEKLLIKMGVLKRWKQDDLTAIEGIGPKIRGLLLDGGITTWRMLSTCDVSRLQSILDAAGKRYKLADPGSWPKQAEMAADGRWDDLEEYQDFLQGGK